MKRLLNRQFLIFLIIAIFSLGLFVKEFDKIRSEAITFWQVDFAADCAVVLTGGPGRIREGFDLLSKKQVKKLIISGAHPNAGLREVFPLWPLYGSLSEKDVIFERRSGTTYGNAQQTLPIVEAMGCRDIVLVTSQIHMSRAFRTFRSAFPEKYEIYKDAILPGQNEAAWIEIWTEVLKSLFYSIWAYQV